MIMAKITLKDGTSTIVDDDMVEKLSKHWWISAGVNRNYVVTQIHKDGKRKTTGMHRIIMDCPEGMVVDHINGDTRDNRKVNLRICTQSINNRNRVGAKGIYKHKNGRWYARAKKDGKYYYIGSSKIEAEAHKMYVEYTASLGVNVRAV